MEQNRKIIDETALSEILKLLYSWMPVKIGKNGAYISSEDFPDKRLLFSVDIGNDKKAIEIRDDGGIYILNNDGQRIKLQNYLYGESGDGGCCCCKPADMTMKGYNDIIISDEYTRADAFEILEDDTIKRAIKKLDMRSDSKIVEKSSYLEFPTIGKRNIIYRDISQGKQYIWDPDIPGYKQTSADIISGGGANW